MQCYLIIRYSFFVEKFRKFVRNVLQKFVAEIRLSLFSLYPVPLSIFFNMNDTVFASKSDFKFLGAFRPTNAPGTVLRQLHCFQ